MGLLLLIPGIILGLIHPELFSWAYQLSTLLIWIGGILIALQILFFFIVGGVAIFGFKNAR